MPLISGMVAIGGALGLAATPASALELGDIRLHSSLGQPLRASIAYALGPGEQLYDFCISLRPAAAGSGMPAITRTLVSVSDGAIVLTGSVPVREPLLNLRLAVDCPYSPHLQREFTLMLDPGEKASDERQSARFARSATAATPAPRTAGSGPRVRAPGPDSGDRTPIPAGSSYVVRTGDTLSTIAARVEGRGAGLWASANALAAANPGAFVNGDLDRLMAGSTLIVPDLLESAVPVPAVAPDTLAAEQPEPATGPGEAPPAAEALQARETAGSSPGLVIIGGAEEPAAADTGPAQVEDPGATAADEVVAPADAEFAAGATEMVEPAGAGFAAGATAAGNDGAPIPSADELEPGDVVMPAPEVVTDARPAPAEVPAAVPVVAQPAETGGSWSWLAWLGGGALGLAAAFFAFGRRLRDRFAPAPVERSPGPAAAEDEACEPTLENRAIDDVDFRLGDPVLAGATALDADLVDGTGLVDGDEAGMLQDFSFADAGDEDAGIDLEISDDFAKEVAPQPTDVILPTHRIDESSILKAEVMPGEDDHDLSMIFDATQQETGVDTASVDSASVSPDEDDHQLEGNNLDSEIGQMILEQDYQDELTATQALNVEIERAAREISDRLDSVGAPAGRPAAEDAVERPRDEATAEMPATPGAPGAALAETTPDPADTGDADMTAELTAKLGAGAEAENDASAGDSGAHAAVEMAAAGSDVTVDPKLRSGKTGSGKD